MYRQRLQEMAIAAALPLLLGYGATAQTERHVADLPEALYRPLTLQGSALPLAASLNREAAAGDGSDATATGYALYLPDSRPGSGLRWGAGLSLSTPEAHALPEVAGWRTGPAAFALGRRSWGSVGILGQHQWSIASGWGESPTDQSLIQPFARYRLDHGWFLVTDMRITVDWEDEQQRWQVPLGGGIGRVFSVGDQQVDSRMQARYNLVGPDGGSDWELNLTWRFLFPNH